MFAKFIDLYEYTYLNFVDAFIFTDNYITHKVSTCKYKFSSNDLCLRVQDILLLITKDVF